MKPLQWSSCALLIFVPTLGAIAVALAMMEFGPLSTSLVFAFAVITCIVFAVEVVARSMPRSLLQQSEDNCFRLDGRKSSRRTREEVTAMAKFKRDLWAIGLMACIALVIGGTAMNFYLVPIPVVLRGAEAFAEAPGNWRAEMGNVGIDVAVESHLRKQYRISPSEANDRAKEIWLAVPIIFIGGLLYLSLVVGIAYRWYKLALADFRNGLQRRQDANARKDIRHVQHVE